MNLTTILEEAVNGWMLSVYTKEGKQVFVYERYIDAMQHRKNVEEKYVGDIRNRLKVL